MSPPPGIAQDVLEYIHLEFGESPEDPDALKLSELIYDGAFPSGDFVIHYWHFPYNGAFAWVSAEDRGDGYYISGFPTEEPEEIRAHSRGGDA